MPAATATRSFSPALFAFLKELADNNDRDWFKANQARFERDAREPALEFIEDFAPHLERISPHFVADARKAGGSLFRIHRDVRFARDKSPYKTHIGIQFRHEQARSAHTPGFYLHLEPGNVFAGVGIWRPESALLAQLRTAIDEHPAEWKKATTAKGFASTFELGGDSLKRPPAGYSADHPLIDDLKRKDFVGMAALSQRAATSPGFIDEYARTCAAAAPLVRFICRALDLPM